MGAFIEDVAEVIFSCIFSVGVTVGVAVGATVSLSVEGFIVTIIEEGVVFDGGIVRIGSESAGGEVCGCTGAAVVEAVNDVTSGVLIAGVSGLAVGAVDTDLSIVGTAFGSEVATTGVGASGGTGATVVEAGVGVVGGTLEAGVSGLGLKADDTGLSFVGAIVGSWVTSSGSMVGGVT